MNDGLFWTKVYQLKLLKSRGIQDYNDFIFLSKKFPLGEFKPTAGEYCEVKLGDASDPGVDTSHIIRYRYRKNLAGGGQMRFTVFLYQGGSMIASSIPDTDVSDAWITGTFTLETYEAAQITDYTDLRLRFDAVQVTT